MKKVGVSYKGARQSMKKAKLARMDEAQKTESYVPLSSLTFFPKRIINDWVMVPMNQVVMIGKR